MGVEVPAEFDSECHEHFRNTAKVVEPNSVTDTSQGRDHRTNIEPGPSPMATKINDVYTILQIDS